METPTVQKIHLKPRLDPDLIELITRKAEAQKISVNDLIRFAFEALEREEKLPATVDERMRDMNETLSILVDALKSKTSEPAPRSAPTEEVMTEKRLRWLFDKVLLLTTHADYAIKQSPDAGKIEADYIKTKVAMGL